MTDRGNWIQTYTGRAFYPTHPSPEDVDIVDIAHALSMQCRFAGHVQRFYSVAEHCLLVSKQVPPDYALAALLHDAAEAYVTDVPRPLKHAPGMQSFRQYEAMVAGAIAEHFGLDAADFEHPCVKLADAELLHTERRDLMADMSPGLTPMSAMPWGMGLPGEAISDVDLRASVSPAEVCVAYLRRFYDLRG